MKCLILGGAGFIGSHVVDAMVDRGYKVRVLDLPRVNISNISHRIKEIDLILGDFYNENFLNKVLSDIDVVVHLICETIPETSNENPIYDVERNITGSLRLLDLSRKNNVKKIIFASSGGAVYGVPKTYPIPETHPNDPICSYGITKLTVEKYLELYRHLYGLEYTVFRLGNPYGERQRTSGQQGAVAVFLGNILSNKKITIRGDGSIERDSFYIEDLPEVFIKACESETPSRIYNIASGESCSLNNLLHIISDITKKDIDVEYTQAKNSDILANCLDVRLAREEMSWNPKVSLEEGVSKTWKWLCKQEIKK
jgi:UDP-glucose 4-epimerase